MSQTSFVQAGLGWKWYCSLNTRLWAVSDNYFSNWQHACWDINSSFPFGLHLVYQASSKFQRSLFKCTLMLRRQLPSRRILFSGVKSVKIHLIEILLTHEKTGKQDILMFNILVCQKIISFLAWMSTIFSKISQKKSYSLRSLHHVKIRPPP